MNDAMETEKYKHSVGAVYVDSNVELSDILGRNSVY